MATMDQGGKEKPESFACERNETPQSQPGILEAGAASGSPNNNNNEIPFSVFTTSEKRYIVFMASWAGFFSPVSSQIYYPALNSLAKDLDASITLINLTLTSYMIFQGLSPMFVGDFANKAGRRPAYTICFTIYIAANVGLALQDSYAALFVLRCMQSAGISTTIALSSAVVADITTASQRGSYMGFVTAGSLLGPSVGPVVGGLLSQYLGWRSIFWFLVIFSGVFMVFFLLFFPETAREVVGDGSIPPPKWNLTITSYFRGREARRQEERDSLTVLSNDNNTNNNAPLIPERKNKLTFPNPLITLAIVFQKDTFIILSSNAILFAAFYDVSATIPSIYSKQYNLNDVQIGLCYIPFGLGATIASIGTGKFLDYNYRRLARPLGFPIVKNRDTDLSNFPIEKARLEITFPLILIGSMTVVAFGWFLDFGIHLAAPTTVLFMLGLVLTGSFNAVSALLVDLYPARAATATAANNFVRCLLGAGATGVVDPMIGAMGRGWCFSFIAFVMLVTVPLLLVVVRFGLGWRSERRVKEEVKLAG